MHHCYFTDNAPFWERWDEVHTIFFEWRGTLFMGLLAIPLLSLGAALLLLSWRRGGYAAITLWTYCMHLSVSDCVSLCPEFIACILFLLIPFTLRLRFAKQIRCTSGCIFCGTVHPPPSLAACLL